MKMKYNFTERWLEPSHVQKLQLGKRTFVVKLLIYLSNIQCYSVQNVFKPFYIVTYYIPYFLEK